MSHLSDKGNPACLYKLAQAGQEVPDVCTECGLGPCKTWRPYMGVSMPRLPATADLAAQSGEQPKKGE